MKKYILSATLALSMLSTAPLDAAVHRHSARHHAHMKTLKRVGVGAGGGAVAGALVAGPAGAAVGAVAGGGAGAVYDHHKKKHGQ